MEKHIFLLFGALMAPEDEVDPLVQVAGDVLRLERSSVYAYERLRGALRPWRQYDVVHTSLPLAGLHTEVAGLGVDQELAFPRVELGNELLKRAMCVGVWVCVCFFLSVCKREIDACDTLL
jgi:hypothetical protein